MICNEETITPRRVMHCMCVSILLILFWVLVITGVIKIDVITNHVEDLFYLALSSLLLALVGLSCTILVACGYSNPVTIINSMVESSTPRTDAETEDISICNCFCYHFCCCCYV